MKNHTELLLATPSMCQSRDLLIHVLKWRYQAVIFVTFYFNTSERVKTTTCGYVNKLDIWVPHKLNRIQLTQRISICDSLLKRNETDPVLKLIITGDEKWVVYDNVRKRSWSKRNEPAQLTLIADIHQKKSYAECLVGFQRYCLF